MLEAYLMFVLYTARAKFRTLFYPRIIQNFTFEDSFFKKTLKDEVRKELWQKL